MEPDHTPQTPQYDQPVAYDAQGRPLYAHPPQQPVEPRTLTQTAASQVVHVTRALEPIKQELSEETKRRHERSVHVYPDLNLSEHEYVISAIRRHPIGLIVPLTIGVLLIATALTILFNYTDIIASINITGQLADPSVVAFPIILFSAFVALGMITIYYVYIHNRFYLTNESVIQEIQVTPFSKHEQTASLGNIEDASYYQEGVFQQMFNYGSIRLSTQGDETTYRFNYVANPKQHIAALNNAVEAFKNGRPVSD